MYNTYLHAAYTYVWRKRWQPTPVLLPGKSHGQRSLVGCSPWGLEELDMTERLHFHFSLSCIGEGNGHSHQCSCLENPRDGRAWWAAVYGVAQSRTRLKRLSSSSSSSTYHSIRNSSVGSSFVSVAGRFMIFFFPCKNCSCLHDSANFFPIKQLQFYLCCLHSCGINRQRGKQA